MPDSQETSTGFDPERSSLERMDARVDEIGERLAKIEGSLEEKPKSLAKKVADYGGLVALVLSIVIGTYTVYDKLFAQPAIDVVRSRGELRNKVRELADINARIAGFDWTNMQAATAQMQALTPQRIALRDEILAADQDMSGVLKFSDRLLLASEFEFFAENERALEQADLAFGLATDSLQRANAIWAQARIHGRSSKLTEMRSLFARAIGEFKKAGLAMTAFPVMQTYIQWIGIELALGSCADATQVHSMMVADFRAPDVVPATRLEISKQFGLMIAQSRETCGLSLPAV